MERPLRTLPPKLSACLNEPAIDGEIPREKRIPQQLDVHAATLISRLAMPRRSYPHPAPIFTQSSAALSAPGIEAEVFRFHAT
jgi:hypothetical protein